MSRTEKDKPWRCGGNRHKWVIASRTGNHGRFTRRMRRRRRYAEKRELQITGERPSTKSKLRYVWFDYE